MNRVAHNLKTIVLLVLVIILAITVAGLGFKVTHTTESKTTKLGFEDIGEFATQSAYCTEVSSTANARKLFGHNLRSVYKELHADRETGC